jgi:hypothetical protein
LARIDINLDELLAPIRQMREEIQKMNDALRQTVQLQSQMASHQRQAANSYGPTKAGAALQIRDLVAARGGNVYDIGSGAPIPPSNINPTGSPLGSHLPGGIAVHRSYLGAQSILSQGGTGIAAAFAGQAGFQNDLNVKKEREEAIKLLSGSTNTTAKILLDVSKKIEQERTTASETLKKATEEYGKASESGSRDLAKFAKELDQAAKNFNKVNQKAEQFSTTLDDFIKKGGAGGGGGDGGGGGGFGGWWNKYGGMVGKGIAGAAYATGVGFQLAGTFSGVQAMGLQQGLGAIQAIPQNIAATESLRYQKYMATVAPTTGEQMLEAYGNLLTPGKKTFTYLGVGNRQAREATASRMFSEELKASEAERKSATYGAIGGGITQGVGYGALVAGGAALSTTVVGALVGVPMMAAGLAGLATGGSNLFSSISGAQTGLAGKKEGGIFDMPGAGLLFDEANARAEEVRKQYQSEVTLKKEQNEGMLLNAEKERFEARRLSMGLDENLAAMRMRTAATTMAGGAAVSGFEMFQNMPTARAEAIADRYARLGYSVPEVGQIYNTYASMMGTTRGADRLLGLSRAGVGSVEQMASNVLGISAVSGKQGDTKQLENIFAKAFESGLKGAPAIQRFSQAAMEMSQALKIQSATGAAGFLSQLTGAIRGTSGSALMYMEEAKSGLAGLAGTTGATTGLMGTLKVLAGAGTGLTMGTGLGLASRSNVVQVQEAIQQLAKGGDYTKLTGLAREMVGAQIASGSKPADAMADVRRQLQAQAAAQISPFAAEFKRRSMGQEFSAVQAQAKELLKKGDAEGLKNLMSRFKDITTGMAGLEAEGAAQALLLSGVDPGDFKKGQSILSQEKGKGAAVAAADFATVNYKRVLNKAAIDASKGINRDVTDQELIETAKGMGLKGNDQELIQQMKGAAGVKPGEAMKFSQLTTAMSLLSDAEGVRAQNTVIQSFSDKAVEQLANAMRGKASGGGLDTKPGVGANPLPNSDFAKDRVNFLKSLK